jgi:malonyl-CoA O-methyltransferase
MSIAASIHDAYDQWAKVYPPVPHNPLMHVEQAALLELLPDVVDSRVLDLACGSGRYAALLEAAGAAQVVGIDYSVAMLNRAALSARVRGDMARLPLRSAAFDLVISGLALGHASDLFACAREVARVLRPGGVLLYSDFHDDAWRAGLTRSFKDVQGQGVTLPRDGYPLWQHFAALTAAGFAVEVTRELRVGLEFSPRFTGSDDLYRRHHGVPLIMVVRARTSP